MNLLPLRLLPGVDLRRALEEALQQHRWTGGFVASGIGSLTQARLRYADAASETVLPGPLEILSLSGSLSLDGAHLHMAVSDAGGRVCGGHVGYGNTVRTTAEVLLVPTPGWQLHRELGEATGFKELVARPVDGVRV